MPPRSYLLLMRRQLPNNTLVLATQRHEENLRRYSSFLDA